MAKVRSPLFDIMSGSMGATLFRKTRYGTVLAKKTIPVNRKTVPKQSSTARFSNASRLWAKVNPFQVGAWNKLGDTFIKTDKLGNTFSMRGLDLFKQINRTLIEIGEPLILSAPKKVFPRQMPAPRFDIIASPKLQDIRLYFKSLIPKNTKYIIFATPMLKHGRNSPQLSKFRIIAVLDHTFLSGFSLLGEYLSVFPINTADTNRIAFRIKPVSTISGLTASEFSLLQAPDSKPLILKTKITTPATKHYRLNTKH